MRPKPTLVAYSRTSLAIIEVPQPGHVTELALTVPVRQLRSGGDADPNVKSILPGRPLTSTHALCRALLASQKDESSGISAWQAGFGHFMVRAQK